MNYRSKYNIGVVFPKSGLEITSLNISSKRQLDNTEKVDITYLLTSIANGKLNIISKTEEEVDILFKEEYSCISDRLNEKYKIDFDFSYEEEHYKLSYKKDLLKLNEEEYDDFIDEVLDFLEKEFGFTDNDLINFWISHK